MTTRGRALPAAALAAAASLAGCVSGAYWHGSVDEPIAAERLEALRPGVATLGRCLDALGAPNRVFEHRVAADGTSGVALLWFWRDAAGWGLEVSGGDELPGSVAVERDAADLPGCVLWFGSDLVLERWRLGTVGELAPTRRRPSAR